MFKVFWINTDGKPDCESFDDLTTALSAANGLRQDGFTFVNIASENPNSVGKPGVDTVKDIANYDGWISRGRAP